MQQLEIVYHLVKEKGMTLDGARQKLKSKKDDETRRVEAVSKLTEIKKELQQLEEEFNQLHAQQKYAKRSTQEG